MNRVDLGICDIMRCPECGNELDEDNYCDECYKFFDEDDFDEFSDDDLTNDLAMRFVLIAHSGL